MNEIPRRERQVTSPTFSRHPRPRQHPIQNRHGEGLELAGIVCCVDCEDRLQRLGINALADESH